MTENGKSEIENSGEMNADGKLVMAHRYLYYCKGISVIDDRTYDLLEKNALLSLVNTELNSVGSDIEESYSMEIKDIANSLLC